MRAFATLALCLSVLLCVLAAPLHASTPPPDTTTVPTDSVVVSGAIDSAGTLSATVRMVMRGNRGRILQRLMEQGHADSTASDMSRLAATLSPSGHVKAVTVQEARSLSDGYRLVFTASIPGYVHPDAPVQTVRPPLPGFPLPDVPKEPRAGLLSLGLPHAVVHRTRVALPEGLRAFPGSSASDSTSFAHFTLAARSGGRELVDVQKLVLRQGIVPIDEYKKYRIFAAMVGATSQAPFLVIQDSMSQEPRILTVPGAEKPTFVETDLGTPPPQLGPLPAEVRNLMKTGSSRDTLHSEPGDAPPSLTNGPEIARFLQTLYPPNLKNVGIGGRVILWVWVSKSGMVTEVVVKKSSGYAALDAAAVRVCFQFRLRPARHHGRPIGVWIAQPISFVIRR